MFETLWVYGMRFRGFAPGCQPMYGFVEREDDPDGVYWDILLYNRPLTPEEEQQYELNYIGVEV